MIQFLNTYDDSLVYQVKELDYEIDAQSITSVDYFKIESRTASIKLFENTWLMTHLVTDFDVSLDKYIIGSYTSATENEDTNLSNFSLYKVRIVRDNIILYTGYFQRTDRTYNKKKKLITINLTDIYGRIIDKMDRRVFTYTDFELSYYTKLQDCIKTTIPKFADGFISDVNISANLAGPEIGLPIDTDILIDGYDNDWPMWEWDAGGHYVLQIGQKGGYYLDNDGIVNLVMWKQWTYYSGQFGQYINEVFRVFHVQFPFASTQAIVVLDTVYTERLQVSSGETPNLDETYDIYPEVADSISISSENAEDDPNVYSVRTETVGDDFLMYVHFAGRSVTRNIEIIEGENNSTVLKTLLFLNNLTLYSDNLGNIFVKPKTESVGSIIIRDNDILDYEVEGVLYKNPDYSGILSIIDSNSLVNLEEEVELYYGDIMNNISDEISLDVMNNYNISIFNKIVVYGEDYLVSEIALDKNGQTYKIKAWRL